MSTLFNGDNSDSEGGLNINNDYASSYNNWRQKEELNKLKTKYGNVDGSNGVSDDDSDDSSTSEEEEEDELKEQFDKDFYKTLACLKKKDPRIYEKDTTFFNDTHKAQELLNDKKQQLGDKSGKEKAVFLRDYERKMILEREGKYSDSEDEDALKRKERGTDKFTYVEEQRQLKDSFKHALSDEEQGDDTLLLKPKSKSEKEKEKEEADYIEWLKGQELEINPNQQEELKPLRDFWNNPDLDSNEKFLRDYVLNNKYKDEEYSGADMSYEHMIHDSDENLSEDERNIEKQEEFEHKYNFRFEEPDQEFIKRYPRTMENSIRKKDTRRAQKRVEVKKRKEDEKLRKREELMQLKAFKRKEIEEKIEKLREITGNDDIRIDDIDLDGDFDPNEHDRKMTELFNEDYYAAPDEDAKPEFPDVDDELEIEGTWDNYDPNKDDFGGNDEEPDCEDPDFNMDAEYDGSKSVREENEQSTKKRKRRRSKFAELLSKEKPKFDPKLYQSYEEYFDKYYSLDYEDMIGDLPCRFKYRKVVPNDYGLSVEEILMADDKELNKWCSLKKALQYKADHVELNEVRTYQQKAKNESLKRKLLRSLYSATEEEENPDNEANVNNSSVNDVNTETKKKRRRNKKNRKANNTETDRKASANNVEHSNDKQEDLKDVTRDSKPKKRKQKSTEQNQPIEKKKRKTNKTEVSNTEAIQKSGEEHKNKSSTITNLNVERVDNVPNTDVERKDSKSSKVSKKKPATTRKKGSKRKENRATNDNITSLNPERLRMYGINPKKLKNKLKYGNK